MIDNDGIDFNESVSFKTGLDTIGKIMKLSGKKLFMPVRLAISGQSSGPDLGLIAHLLGKEK